MASPQPGPIAPAGDAVISVPREIPFNYTSASDRQAVSFLLGPAAVRTLDELRSARVTGRSARILMRLLGEVLIHRRNPYLFQELVSSTPRRKRFFENAAKDMETIAAKAEGDSRVLDVLAQTRALIAAFRAEVEHSPDLRNRVKRELAAVVGAHNILFDPFTLVSHATDATDWRLHLPLAVVTPDDEQQVAPLLVAIGRLGLKVVPRGAGTGLTGGAVPLRSGCVVVNTEKLNRIRAVTQRDFHLDDGSTASAHVMEAECGVITEKAMEHAAEKGLVFATDPTSAWASTLGGNISENAGGKLAVRWGTCIDNLLEWRMAMPTGVRWTVRRTNHQLRKILPQDTVTFDVLDEQETLVKSISLRGTEIRKNGLWKDITNKALGGVPGLQKEGTDGIITSAIFVLYPEYAAKKTLCLEFFGPDFDEASRVILELSRIFPIPTNGTEALLALEHFDDEYIRAIDYKVKAPRAETPKAALLIDIAGSTQEQAMRGVERVRSLLREHPNTQLFVARNPAEAKLFWADRKKLGAIARRTNAFKMNEDIVIPLDTLAEFARFIDGLNIEEERYAQLRFSHRAAEVFTAAEEAERVITPDAAARATSSETTSREATSSGSTSSDSTSGDSTPGQIAAKTPAAVALCASFRQELARIGVPALRGLTHLQEFRHGLNKLVRGYPVVLAALERAFHEVRDRRIVLATHMHAGDGNVHVNIPVLSNDRPMLERADQVIDRVMEKVISLGGVVSGEHGIGLTKLKYLEPERVAELTEYRRQVDPQGLMNPGKLEDYEALGHIFTPSFNLLELEARILQHGQLEELSRKIAHCVRCGKCKVDCCVYYPARGMFYHPRNKNLAIGSLIEALLYDAQRERSTHFELLQWLEEVADHCTVCHKCLAPCPVDIDTGEVSVLEREILSGWGYKHTPLPTRLTLKYLESRSPAFNHLFRTAVVQIGSATQRVLSKVVAPLQPASGNSSFYPLRLMRSSVAPVPSQTLRDVLPECGAGEALIFEPDIATPAKAQAAVTAETSVFYFPGCGSERLFSDVSMAAIHLLLKSGTRVVLPPPFLCCGFPAHVNAKTSLHSRTVLQDTILFSQIRDMLAYLDFDACVISCGTCREGLMHTDTAQLFGRVVDISAYLLERGLRANGDGNFLYHAPCHDSLDGKAEKLLANFGGFGDVSAVPHCCSEAGTLALSRPDISGDMLHRKRESLREAIGRGEAATVLTNCPSCLQGLGRSRDLGVRPQHIVVALAEKISGADWKLEFAAQAARAINVAF
jgi:FAD/FMN-containing dehydrogenase/Fe-S oxidoreductase